MVAPWQAEQERQNSEPRWQRCSQCHDLIYGKRFAQEWGVCPNCGHHAQLRARDRISRLLDDGTARPITGRPTLSDPLGFVDSLPYQERLARARASAGSDEAITVASGTLGREPVVVAAMEFGFMGGSLGCDAGELIAAAAQRSVSRRAPLLLVTASGGARMQEGVLALMQMAKTSQALLSLDEAGILTISLIADPTYGGVAASYATLADVIISEPGARLGFAGPRVIEQTIRQQLPAGFQTAEFLFRRGLIDAIVARAGQRPTLRGLLALQPTGRWPELAAMLPGAPGAGARWLVQDAAMLPARDPWTAVKLARHPSRPTAVDYASQLLDDFHELHGDRLARDCPSIVAGLGRLGGQSVAVIGTQKGHDTRELVERNFGMPTPAGYRKAARVLRLAAKLGIPVITLIDTPGAHPGLEAEENGQASAIAENLRLMSGLPVPIVAVVTGEGGSGGALALGVADRVLAASNAIYSVISPEGCAAILWRDAAAAPQAAVALQLDAPALLRNGVVDSVVAEPGGGAHEAPGEFVERVGMSVADALRDLAVSDVTGLVRARRRRFERYGMAGLGPAAAGSAR